MGDAEFHPCVFRNLAHAFAGRHGGGHRFFDIHGLAGPHRGDGQGLMYIRWRGNVNGIHRRVGNEGVCIVMPGRYAVSFGVIPGLCGIPAHHGGEGGPFNFSEGGSALFFGDVAASDDAPAEDVCGHGVIAGCISGIITSDDLKIPISFSTFQASCIFYLQTQLSEARSRI